MKRPCKIAFMSGWLRFRSLTACAEFFGVCRSCVSVSIRNGGWIKGVKVYDWDEKRWVSESDDD